MDSGRSLRGVNLILAGVFCVLAVTLAPHTSEAATNLNVQQVLPPAGNNSACAPILVSEVHPFIYDGKLHSFEFTMSAPSYVALGGSAGETPIDFQYMTRWNEGNGNVRIHVDIPSTSLSQDLPLRVVLISAAGKVTCTASVTAIVPKMPSVPQTPTANNTGTSYPTPITHPTSPTHSSTGSNNVVTHVLPSPTSSSSSEQGNAATNTSAVNAPMFVGALHSLGDLCQVGGASRLWIVLVVLYGLFVLALLLQKPDSFGIKTLEWNIALILLLYVGLVSFWYLSLPCRTGSWAPAIVTAIAVFGLICLLILGRVADKPVLLLEDKE